MATEDYLIEDFGARCGDWEFITDSVMGGKSTGQMEFSSDENGNAIRMTGRLSLENNGGFIQVRRRISDDSKYFDARGYKGVGLVVKADGNEYAVHLRSRGTWLPWQYYEAKFDTNGEFQEIYLPFDNFKPYYHNRKLNTAKLTTVAVVALKKEFEPDIYVSRIFMYAKEPQNDTYRELTEQEKYVIIDKGTERPFTGKYNAHFEKGVYRCRRCRADLFSSESKFKSGCGWPAFDDELPNSVRKQPDSDGVRTEILCANCGAHLGHIFHGEELTEKNTRYCVNSISLDFEDIE